MEDEQDELDAGAGIGDNDDDDKKFYSLMSASQKKTPAWYAETKCLQAPAP